MDSLLEETQSFVGESLTGCRLATYGTRIVVGYRDFDR